MTKNIRKASSVLLIVLISAGLMVFFCRKVAETVFFDKFFYQKSKAYGYNQDLSYNTRVKDMYDLGLISDQAVTFPHDGNPQSKVLGAKDDQTYKIALLGDSFVWGQGVKETDRLSVYLEKALKPHHPTKVFSLGLPGDSFLDHLAKVDALVHEQAIDVYIIPMVMNDTLLLPEADHNRYHSPEAQAILDRCQKEHPNMQLLVYPDLSKIAPENVELATAKMNSDTEASWTNELSVCIAQASINKMEELTHGKLIFLVTNDYSAEQNNFKPYEKMITSVGGTIVRSREGIDMLQYKLYFLDPHRYFRVSSKEGHPSALAYELYANVLAKHLLNEPNWNFPK